MLSEKIILASKSPRRVEILRAVGWDFESRAANIDESRHESEEPVAYVERLAREKAATIARDASNGLVLGADTVVVVEDEILGQPGNNENARRMLELLSGKWHQVLTGIAIMRGEREEMVAHETTRVRFAELSQKEIDWYVSTEEPLDKAGAYAIQGQGGIFIEEIEGDYFNIVGLPIRLVYQLLGRMR
ncbi:MAG TPA: Maf family protein [Pyrinomonadaceae bacterium]|nr:Maf family protein [Pyrinomonadaceae bacterium]